MFITLAANCSFLNQSVKILHLKCSANLTTSKLAFVSNLCGQLTAIFRLVSYEGSLCVPPTENRRQRVICILEIHALQFGVTERGKTK